MPEVYPINVPDLSIANVRLIGRSVVGVASSPFTLSQQVYKHQGQAWEVDVTLPPMTRSQAEPWITFLLRLNGRYGTFLIGDPNGQTPRGLAAGAAGSPVVQSFSSSIPDIVNIAGATKSLTGYLRAGDYIQIGTNAGARLYKVLEDVSSNVDTTANIKVFPSVRGTLTPGEEIITSNCKGVFRLASNEATWEIDNSSMYNISFGATEVI